MVVPVKIIDDFRYFTHEKAVYAAESLIVAVGKIPNLTDNWRPDVKSIMDLAEVTARFKSAQQEAANGDRVKAATVAVPEKALRTNRILFAPRCAAPPGAVRRGAIAEGHNHAQGSSRR